MLPVLAFVGGADERTLASIRDAMASEFHLTDADLRELLPNGRQTRFSNRVGWAASYLKQARLLDSPRRASYRITDRGREVLASNPDRIWISSPSNPPLGEELDRLGRLWSCTGIEGPLSARFLQNPWDE